MFRLLYAAHAYMPCGVFELFAYQLGSRYVNRHNRKQLLFSRWWYWFGLTLYFFLLHVHTTASIMFLATFLSVQKRIIIKILPLLVLHVNGVWHNKTCYKNSWLLGIVHGNFITQQHLPLNIISVYTYILWWKYNEFERAPPTDYDKVVSFFYWKQSAFVAFTSDHRHCSSYMALCMPKKDEVGNLVCIEKSLTKGPLSMFLDIYLSA